MKSYTYVPSGVCSRKIEFKLDGDKIHNVRFTGGCQGNLTAISKIIECMPAEKVVALFRGNQCGDKNTSCADQLSLALEAALEKQKEE